MLYNRFKVILSNGSIIYINKPGVLPVEKYLSDQYNVPFWGFRRTLISQNETFGSKRSEFKKRVKKAR